MSGRNKFFPTETKPSQTVPKQNFTHAVKTLTCKTIQYAAEYHNDNHIFKTSLSVDVYWNWHASWMLKSSDSAQHETGKLQDNF